LHICSDARRRRGGCRRPAARSGHQPGDWSSRRGGSAGRLTTAAAKRSTF